MSDNKCNCGANTTGVWTTHAPTCPVSLAPAQEVKRPVNEAAQALISLFNDREQLEKLKADYASLAAQLEKVKRQRDAMRVAITKFVAAADDVTTRASSPNNIPLNNLKYYTDKMRTAEWLKEIESAESQLVATREALQRISEKNCGCLSSKSENWHHDTCWKGIAIAALGDKGDTNES